MQKDAKGAEKKNKEMCRKSGAVRKKHQGVILKISGKETYEKCKLKQRVQKRQCRKKKQWK